MKRLRFILFLFIAPPAFADVWAPALTRGAISENGQLVVRVVPGVSPDHASGSERASKGSPAVAYFYHFQGNDGFVFVRQMNLVNPVAPIFHAVANTGELVTLDN